ncbi:MAG TPA: DEAD/DEAH box helicase [Candidatus Angelobacter sp.]|nr:DEAD/DEAH box helicase [Candidatus Angelobacter sp.]
MTLSARLTSYFSRKIRDRGAQVYRDKLVTITDGSDVEVAAEVRGSYVYEVGLVWEEGGALTGWCACPYFDGNGACKHLWATILEAEAKGYLATPTSAEELVFVENFEDDSDDYDEERPRSSKPLSKSFRLTPAITKALAPKPPTWRQKLTGIASQHAASIRETDEWPTKRQIIYVVDVDASVRQGAVVLDLMTHDKKKDGTWSRPVFISMKRYQLSRLPLAEDREILAALEGGKETFYYGTGHDPLPGQLMLRDPLPARLLPGIIRTGRCFLKGGKDPNSEGDTWAQLSWDDNGTWRFGLKIASTDQGRWSVGGVLRRGEEFMPLSAPVLIVPGLLFTENLAVPLEDASFAWMSSLRNEGSIEARESERDDFLTALLSSPDLPPLELPEELQFEEIEPHPQPRLTVRAENAAMRQFGRLQAEVSFQYLDWVVSAHDSSTGRYEADKRRFLRRNLATEKTATQMLGELGAKYVKQGWSGYYNPNPAWEIAVSKMPRTIRTLVEAGWHVEVEGKFFRRPGEFRIEVSSGVDWFELHGEVQYGEVKAHLPALLQALRNGENMVRLGDGSYGVLPEEWLRRIGPLAGMGTPDGTHVVFRQSQAGVLDALLAAQPEARCDETFTRVRKELCSFAGIQAAMQPPGFNGHLRDYQREGLGWMLFLQRYSFGGCLADDMGVGKTAQVLALLETRRKSRDAGALVGPSLAIVPRSLVFNWKDEAARFTPQLRVLDYTGLERKSSDFSGYHLVLTTYGTVRRDILRLKDIEFDYIVLDEAQAVKNAATESSKAVRLLRGQHRLALSGTPVENHLGELWTLFEFLNPGMLGTASVFKLAGEAARNPDGETRRLLAHALKPFILRRTKEQVARELPPKSEQTIYCEMESEQRKLYNELREHYRNALLRRIDTDGLAKSKIQVLEALLRLRQAACHPGLLDQKYTKKPSAKMEVLLERLREIVDEGHKALVFSQFTSLLSIVRQHLDDDGIVYEYLDGRTRNRKERVERFQNDEKCCLFLISLKAGGLGLNLTAAEYVFILDPWWNPAVEAQAVDRAHRIGQKKQIFAYRLIARDSVEEKVLELQQTKRDLAAAIIGADNSLIRDLRREDLELLLS